MPGGQADDALEDLPPLDGGADDVEAPPDDDDFDLDDAPMGDPLDDDTGESDPIAELEVSGSEHGWLTEAEGDAALDVGPMDLLDDLGGDLLSDVDADGTVSTDGIDLGDEGVSVVGDAGEEGPTDADEELREEDLPALDADEEGDVDEADLFDRALLDEEELRWDDRAWTRTDAPPPRTDDRGPAPEPGDGACSDRDATWRRLTATGRAMAAALVDGGAVVVAMVSDDTRAVLVRVSVDGVARIVAEVESEGEDCQVDRLVWDPERQCLFAVGSFGVAAFRA